MGRRGITLTVAVLSGLLLLSAMPNNSSAFPYEIEGYLKDADGSAIPHATLRLTGPIYNISSEQFEEETALFQDATGNSGYFSIHMGVDEPGGFVTGDTVTLSYSEDGGEASVTFTLQDMGTWKNLTAKGQTDPLDFLLSPMGMVLIIIVVFVLVVAAYWYTSREKDDEDDIEDARTKVGRRRR